MIAGDFRDLAQPTSRLRNHSGRALHQRLEDERRVGISFFLLRGKCFLHEADTFPVAFSILARVIALRFRAIERTTITIRSHHLVSLKQHPAVSFVEQINVAERDRANGVAVIRAVQREKAWIGFCAASAPRELVSKL